MAMLSLHFSLPQSRHELSASVSSTARLASSLYLLSLCTGMTPDAAGRSSGRMGLGTPFGCRLSEARWGHAMLRAAPLPAADHAPAPSARSS